MGRLLLRIAYLSTWITLLILEIKKMFVVKKRNGKFVDCFSVIMVLLIIIVYVIDMFR